MSDGALHAEHRKRLRERFMTEGLDSFADHNVLELLLFFSIPRRDTNDLAHTLIKTFGSLAGVVDASPEELMKVDGVGENTAALLKLVPQFTRKYMVSQNGAGAVLDSAQKAGDFILPYFIGSRYEEIYIVMLDTRNKALACICMSEGHVNMAQVSSRKVIETALKYNAAGIILAHNHLSGIALPSQEDHITTTKLRLALSTVGMELYDHIIVAGDDFVSFRDSGLLA